MIKQIKRYRVTCDGEVNDNPEWRGFVVACGTEIVIDATSKYAALQDLPQDWEVEHISDNDVRVICPGKHVDT